MKPFATLLDRLLHSPQRNAKLRLLADYFQATPDPDRGYALAALTGGLDFLHAKPALIRELAMRRSDPVLFALSYDFVGDLAETTALIWPPATGSGTVRLGEVVERLQTTAKAGQAKLIEDWLDQLEPDGRWALLKLITGGLRVGVSARWPSWRWPSSAMPASRRSRSSGTASSRPTARSSPGSRAAHPSPSSAASRSSGR